MLTLADISSIEPSSLCCSGYESSCVCLEEDIIKQPSQFNLLAACLETIIRYCEWALNCNSILQFLSMLFIVCVCVCV